MKHDVEHGPDLVLSLNSLTEHATEQSFLARYQIRLFQVLKSTSLCDSSAILTGHSSQNKLHMAWTTACGDSPVIIVIAVQSG